MFVSQADFLYAPSFADLVVAYRLAFFFQQIDSIIQMAVQSVGRTEPKFKLAGGDVVCKRDNGMRVAESAGAGSMPPSIRAKVCGSATFFRLHYYSLIAPRIRFSF